jgi:antitoxin component of MazEF toxin-antitoxin module
VKKLQTADWIELIKIGVTSVALIAEARAKRRAELAELSPEVAEMTDEDFEAKFGRLRAAADKLSDSAVALVEKGAAEKGAGG